MNQSSDDQFLEHMFGSFGEENRKTDVCDDICGGWLRFGEVFVNRLTGEVQVPLGAGLSQASLAFWQAVQKQSAGVQARPGQAHLAPL